MKNYLIAVFFFTNGLLAAFAQSDSVQPIHSLAFGSCNHQKMKQPMWEQLLKNNPALYISLGDNIYGKGVDVSELKTNFEIQKAHPQYSDFVSRMKVIGIWDDHDYGTNNCGGEMPDKEGRQRAFLDFIGEPAGTPRRAQQGVYTSYTYGTKGNRVKVILLDTRYFREKPCQSGDILGAEQWGWLEQELKTSDAAVNIIGTSIQMVSSEHMFEKWADFPEAKMRLLNLLKSTNANGVVFLSGDLHLAEISKYEGSNANYPLYDFTSSGLTHARMLLPFNRNKLRFGRVYFRKNFGMIHFDWEKRSLRVEMKNRRNKTVISHTIPFAELDGGKTTSR